ncbi:hypothetical protein AX16_007964 [Volvariella volvacea WC 439]|nr:hypothetical protein AX16_007964 [Volvariella volvacea WC 439]
MTVAQESAIAPASFLDTVEGEISFFRSIMRARPVGVHKYFHILGIQNSILKDTGRLVRIEDIWEKLRSCYDLEALDAIVRGFIFIKYPSVTHHLSEPSHLPLQDMEMDGFEIPTSSYNNSTPTSIPSPSPSENLSGHPFFREEFSLPYEEFEPLISTRRMRETASVPSSPAPSPAVASKTRNGRKRGKSRLDMAGLVGGDSDSSALTQESGDEGASGTRGSVVTATDGGTEYAEEEDVEMREPSPAPSAASPKPARNRTKSGTKRALATRTRATASNTRSTKKRKR